MDQTALYNLALGAIGARGKIALPTEQSREAEACNLWFPNIRDQVLASAFWPEATKMQRLALLADQEDETWITGAPRPDYLFAYATPSDMLRPQFTSNYQSFVIQAYGDDQKAIMSNLEAPILVYTFRQTKVHLWSAELQMAIVYGLAANLCIPLTGKTSRAKLLLEQANQLIMAARESSSNANSEMYDSIPDWIAMRGFSDGSPQTRYIYPHGALLTVSNVN